MLNLVLLPLVFYVINKRTLELIKSIEESNFDKTKADALLLAACLIISVALLFNKSILP